MGEILARIWDDLLARTTGPMWFRLILQPLVAAVFGVLAGLRNARRARQQAASPSVLDAAHRRTMFRQAVHDAGKMLVVGVVLDVIFQLIALHTVYPGEALLVAFLLVALPYQIIRTAVAWLASKR